jgi:hypothetical protein
MKTLRTTYDITFRGNLDPTLFALAAEYDLGEVPAVVTVRGLPIDAATLQALLDRADALGLAVVQVRHDEGRGEDDPPAMP